jgi:polyferredoxin
MRVFEVRTTTWRQRAGSIALGAVALLLAIAYSHPALSVPQYLTLGRVSVVSFIDTRGPFWMVGFGITALGVAAGLLTHRAMAIVHSVGLFVSASFAAAIWYGAVTSQPPGPYVSAIMATGYCAFHWVMADSYRGGSR